MNIDINNNNRKGALKLNTKRAYVDNDNEVDTNIIAIKECNLYATSLQYCTIYNVIVDLFSYTEPNVLKMEDSVQKLVFRIEQLDDLNAVLENIYILKNNIRTLKRSMVQVDWNDLCDNNRYEDLSALDKRTKYEQLQEHLYQTQDDLLYVVMALKRINKIRNSTKKNSSKIKSKFIYMSKDLTYNMILGKSLPYCECIVKDIKCQIDTLDDKTSANTIELRKIIVHNLLEKDNVYMKALVPYIPRQREFLENSKEKMFRLYYRENPAIGGIPIIDHFEINIIPILVQITNKLVNHILWYIFPDRYKQHAEGTYTSGGADIDSKKFDYSDIDSIIYYSYHQDQQQEEIMENKPKKKSSKSSANENENDINISDNEINKNNNNNSNNNNNNSPNTNVNTSNNNNNNNNDNNSNGSNSNDDDIKEWKYNENSDEDIMYDQSTGAEGNSSLANIKESGRNRKFDSMNTLSSVANYGTNNGNEKTDNKIEYNVNQMQNRASQNKTFVYIKIPGAHHCISYKVSYSILILIIIIIIIIFFLFFLYIK